MNWKVQFNIINNTSDIGFEKSKDADGRIFFVQISNLQVGKIKGLYC